MPTTQKDIAQKLNISRSLVAGVLSERPGVWASDETRRRILRMAREMSYRPNAAAKSLRTGKTNVIAFVYRCPADNAARSTYSGIVERLAERAGTIGYRLAVSVRADLESVLETLSELATSRTCDLFVLWDDEEAVEKQGELLEQHGVPFVAKGRHEARHPNWPQIDYDHEALMKAAVEYLASRGHSRIAYMGSSSDFIYTRCLRDGYLQAMWESFGHNLDPAMIGLVRQDYISDAQEQMERWLGMPAEQQPTAVVVGANNAAWWGIERALHAVGRKIGDGDGDLAVAGMAWGDRILHHGEGMKFQDVSSLNLIDKMWTSLLPPTLNGKPVTQPVLRLAPSLCPVGRVSLDDYYRELLTMLLD